VSENGIRAFTSTPDDGAPPAVAPFAHATAAGPMHYGTGQMPTDVTGNVEAATSPPRPTRCCATCCESRRCAAGRWPMWCRSALTSVDWDDYAAYAAWFADRLPSRTCVGVTGLAVGARVEIDWVCWRGDGSGATIGS
jgi:2-iminobutanoate/2-iminopropanoate deaminase